MTEDTTHLQWARLTDFGDRLADFEAELPGLERERARRFRVTAARERFVLARTLLRRTVGDMLDRGPSCLVFGVGEHGKPYLTDPKPPAPFGFNLSHSGETVILATASHEVGADVEELRSIPNAEKLARRFFSPSERESVLASEGADRDRAFLRIWTQKEAWLKATGIGVGMRLAEVETEADQTLPPRLVSISGDSGAAERWSLTEADIPGAVCVVAVESPISELDVHRITPEDLEQS